MIGNVICVVVVCILVAVFILLVASVGDLDMDERDIAKKPTRSTEARYGMGYDYYDWICPSCKHFLTYEPNWRNIPKRCPECGQLLEKLTRKEAEE